MSGSGAGARIAHHAKVAAVLAYVVSMGVVAGARPALAQFTYSRSAGSQSDSSALVATPTGLSAASTNCPSSSTYQDSVVPLSWSSSSAVDADGNPMVSYYGVWRSVNGSSYSLLSSLSGASFGTSYLDNTVTGAGNAAVQYTTYLGIVGNYLGSDYDNNISLIGTYDFGTEENLLAGTPDGTRAFAAESGTGAHNVLEVGALYGGANYGTVESTITLAGAAPVPIAVAVAPNDSDLFVLDKANNKLDIVPLPITGSTYTVPASSAVSVGALGDPAALAVTPSSSQVVVANYGSGTVTIVNTSGSVAATVTLPKPTGGVAPAPSAVVINSAGTNAYVLDSANNQVDVVALTGPNTGAVTAHVAVGSQAGATETPADMDVAHNPTLGDEVYVGNPSSGTVTVISVATGATTTVSLGTGADPSALVAAPDGCYVAVAETLQGANDVALVNTTTNAVVATQAGATYTGGAATTIAMSGTSDSFLEDQGAMVAMPTRLSYEVQAGTTNGSGFMSALSSPVTVTLGRGQVP